MFTHDQRSKNSSAHLCITSANRPHQTTATSTLNAEKPTLSLINVINRQSLDAGQALSISSARRLSLATSTLSLTNKGQQSHPYSSTCQMTSCSSSNPSFTNNMIAKLAVGGAQVGACSGGSSSSHNFGARRPSAAPNSAQSKKKRSKLIDILLNSNWSKQSQRSSLLIKLHKILLSCDANFLEEKTGQSPVSLAISSSQINATGQSTLAAGVGTNQALSLGLSLTATTTSCPQSASLFDLQCQSTASEYNQLALQQTNIDELSHSKAPLIERILLLLVKSGALIDFRDADGKTPLHMAAMKSNFWALKTLLELGKCSE